MPPESVTVRAQAIAWQIRLRDGRAQDWDEFAEWLALDPQHSTAYDEVALGDREIEPALVSWASSRTALANDNWPDTGALTTRRGWIIGGMSAAIAAAVALVVLTPIVQSPAEFYNVATAPGQQRVITFADRDRVTLNGGTRIRLDRNNPRFASLDYGEASFKIVHDPRSPFTLQLGDNRLVDVGTAFNVIIGPAGHTVEVAEGAILYNPDGERIALAAGQSLTMKTHERRITLSRKPPAEVGGWQHGRLSYRSSPLSDVAADISRSLGTTVSVQPAIANRSFTGTIEIDRDENRMFPRLAQLLDVEARRSGDGWTLGPARKPTH
jgi:transmembrane sensor